MKRSISTSAAIPVRIPMSIPARTSVGKWTYKYSLEKAIRAARIRAGIPAPVVAENDDGYSESRNGMSGRE